tara:strand:- start:998 stop:1189 length:192 start_codon:yes stop_codon:yes gene_type:complete
MPIHIGDIVKKSGGHSDRGQIGIVLNVSQQSTHAMIVNVMTENGERNWYGEYVEVISLPSAST